MQNCLRPNQVNEYKAEERDLIEKLKQPETDKGAANGQLMRLRRSLENQTPKEVLGKAKDAMLKENKELLSSILDGMPSQEEMRKNPPGAVGKHRMWDKRTKEDVIRWKNNELRLNAGSEDPDICNLERHRPKKSSLSMDNAQIPGTDYYFPNGPVPLQNVMSDEDKESNADTRTKLVAQAIKDNDTQLAKFLGVDLKELKKPPKDPESIL